MTNEEALKLTNDSILQGRILPEQENYSYMSRVREALERVGGLENENIELWKIIGGICLNYKECDVCPLKNKRHDIGCYERRHPWTRTQMR